MKILFIVNMNKNYKTGLYNATHTRIKTLQHYFSIDYKVYNILYKDTKIIKFFKNLLGKENHILEEPSFVYDGIEYENIIVPNNILTRLFHMLNLEFLIFYPIINKRKQEILKYELISAHWAFPQGIFAYFIKKILKKPYCVTYHGSDIHSLNKKRFKKITKILNQAECNIFVSKSLKNAANNKGYFGENFKIIENGVNTELFFPLPNVKIMEIKNQLFKKNCKIVGFVGNLNYVKRADKLGEIFLGVQSQSSEIITFLVVGDGPFKHSLEKFSYEHNLNVIFTGKVEPSEINYYLNIMDILILPSRNEGFPCIVLEAHASGISVVGSSNGGIIEAIGDDSYIVDEGENFESRFSKLVLDKLSQEKEKGKLITRINKEFSLGKLGEKELILYKTIIKKYRE
jgi:teichuronic acid biosynthesis glycosyltransferase TuaC